MSEVHWCVARDALRSFLSGCCRATPRICNRMNLRTSFSLTRRAKAGKMTDLMNTSTHSHHYPPGPNEVAGNRRPARPSSAQHRTTTPTRNRPLNQTNANGLNTTAKLEQSILRHEQDRGNASFSSSKLNDKGKNRLYSTWTPLQDDETNARVSVSFPRASCRTSVL